MLAWLFAAFITNRGYYIRIPHHRMLFRQNDTAPLRENDWQFQNG